MQDTVSVSAPMPSEPPAVTWRTNCAAVTFPESLTVGTFNIEILAILGLLAPDRRWGWQSGDMQVLVDTVTTLAAARAGAENAIAVVETALTAARATINSRAPGLWPGASENKVDLTLPVLWGASWLQSWLRDQRISEPGRACLNEALQRLTDACNARLRHVLGDAMHPSLITAEIDRVAAAFVGVGPIVLVNVPIIQVVINTPLPDDLAHYARSVELDLRTNPLGPPRRLRPQ